MYDELHTIYISGYNSHEYSKYRKTSCINRTKSQNLNVSRLVLQLPLPNHLKPGVRSSMKM